MRRPRTPPALLAALAGALLAGCATAPARADRQPPADAVDAEAVRAGVRATLDAQVAAWNAGSVRGFMDGYARTDTLAFLSGGAVRRGWDGALDGYVRGYPDADAMGTLAFSDLTVHPITGERALAWGRWRLRRAGDAEGGGPGGLFTLLLARTPDGWRVVHDHTSSE
jgi:ketosteroid isomerase-like protein